MEPFTLDEVLQILSTVREDFRNYYTVRFFTGMRTAEVDGLQWKYVDFQRRQILIRETWVGGKLDYTKNDGSQREIDMSEPVYQALIGQREKPAAASSSSAPAKVRRTHTATLTTGFGTRCCATWVCAGGAPKPAIQPDPLAGGW